MKIKDINWSDKNSIIKFLKEERTVEELYEEIDKLGGLSILDHVSEEMREDKELLIAIIEKMPYPEIDYYKVSPELKKDKDVVMAAVKAGMIEEVIDNEDYRNDRDVILAYGQDEKKVARFIGEDVELDDDICSVFIDWYKGSFEVDKKKNKERIINSILLEKLRQYVEEIPSSDGYVDFEVSNLYREPRIAIKKTFVLEGKEYTIEKTLRDIVPEELEREVLSNITRLEEASDEIKNDPEKVKLIIWHDAMALQYASEEIKKNRDIVMTAVEKNGMALQYADLAFREDENVVFRAVHSNGMALQFASESIRNDYRICYEAVQNNINALMFVGEKLKENKAFIQDITRLDHVFIAKKEFDRFDEAIDAVMDASDSLASSDLYEFRNVEDMDDLDDLIQDYEEKVLSNTYNPIFVDKYVNEEGNKVFIYQTATGINEIMIEETVSEDGEKNYNARYRVLSNSPKEYSSSMKSFKEHGWDFNGKTYYAVGGRQLSLEGDSYRWREHGDQEIDSTVEEFIRKAYEREHNIRKKQREESKKGGFTLEGIEKAIDTQRGNTLE